jgi:septal ring factor EnvC (AmiA/AmiB activator)
MPVLGKKSLLFFEKKRSKKNFVPKGARRPCQIRAKRSKSFFATFFSKKVVLTYLFFLSPALAQTNPGADKLRADAARAALLAEQQVEAAAALRRLENHTNLDTQMLAALQAQADKANAAMRQNQAQLEKLLPVMQRLSAQPAATLLATPQSPADALRGILLIQGIAQSIETKAEAVKNQSAVVAALLAEAQAQKTALAAAVAAQAQAEAALNTQIAAEKADEMADADQSAIAAAASLPADTVHDLGDVTQALKPPAQPLSNPLPNQGGAPIAGRLVQHFGQNVVGGPAQGVIYRAPAGARVITPCAGTIAFAGTQPQLTSYGHIVLVDCGGGYVFVLTQMSSTDVSTGEHVAHGQPVGEMAGFDPADPTYQPYLYVELRQNGTPIDPANWLMGPAG